jgi:hypothetical protein
MSAANHPKQARGWTLLRRGLTALLFLAGAGVAIGQEVPAETGGGSPPIPLPDIYCFSGSPLLLQVNVPNPGQSLEAIRIESAFSSFAYAITDELDHEVFQFYVNPFLEPGYYELEVTLRTREGSQSRSHIDVGFVDFVWGRDNLSFGNNSKYTSVIGSFGEVLLAWLDERFGDVDEASKVLLVDHMYGFFGKNTGRCYAFAGTEVRYWRWPELLPSYYDSAHDLGSSVARYQREMNYLQFDIVFNHFFAGPGRDQLRGPMNTQQLEEQVGLIEERIVSGEPVAVGFAGPDIHHSMLVFGFLRNRTTNTVDLLVANNWKNDEKLNIHSRDAEIVRVYLNPDLEQPRVQWRYDSGIRNREIDRLFMVDVSRDPYDHDRSLLDGLIDRLWDQVVPEQRAIIVVEESAGARIVSGEQSSGWFRSRRTNELEDVWYERVGDTYRFTCPADGDFKLEIADEGDSRILAVAPGREPGDIAHYVVVTDPSDGDPITRRFSLPE